MLASFLHHAVTFTYEAQSGDLATSISRRFGTNPLQLSNDNGLSAVASFGGGTFLDYCDAPLTAGNIYQVNPGPSIEARRFMRTDVRDVPCINDIQNVPKPCSGYFTDEEKAQCWCMWHSTGTYTWPFDQQCNRFINCDAGCGASYNIGWCPDGTVAWQPLETKLWDIGNFCVPYANAAGFECNREWMPQEWLSRQNIKQRLARVWIQGNCLPHPSASCRRPYQPQEVWPLTCFAKSMSPRWLAPGRRCACTRNWPARSETWRGSRMSIREVTGHWPASTE